MTHHFWYAQVPPYAQGLPLLCLCLRPRAHFLWVHSMLMTQTQKCSMDKWNITVSSMAWLMLFYAGLKINTANVYISISETGWPRAGTNPYTSKENALMYNANLTFMSWGLRTSWIHFCLKCSMKIRNQLQKSRALDSSIWTLGLLIKFLKAASNSRTHCISPLYQFH